MCSNDCKRVMCYSSNKEEGCMAQVDYMRFSRSDVAWYCPVCCREKKRVYEVSQTNLASE